MTAQQSATQQSAIQQPATPQEHQLSITGEDGEVVECAVRSGHFVLHELQRLRVPSVLIGCRGGCCGVCRIRVTDGDYEAKRMAARHVPADELADGVVLACRVRATSDLAFEVLGERDAEPER